MEKNNESENFEQRLKERRKRVKVTDILVDLSLLFIPVVLFIVILGLSTALTIIMLAFIALILPMLYTVEKRLRYHLTGIGKPHFSYIDGYREFFTRNQFGMFGILTALSVGFLIVMLMMIAASFFLTPLANAFGASDAINQFVDLYMSDTATTEDLSSFLLNEGSVLMKPASIMISIVMLPAEFVALFVFFDNNLTNHYLATVVLPDIDKNMPAASARNLARNTFGRGSYKYRTQQKWLRNWPFYLAFLVIHVLLTLTPIWLETDNVSLLALMVLLPTAVSILVAFCLNYFVLLNEYALIEECQNTILLSMPMTIRVSVYQTYNNPNYIHGEESAARGCFVPAPTYTEQQEVYRSYPFMDPNFYQRQNPSQPQYHAPEPEEKKDDEPIYEDKQEEVKGGVVDFSQFAETNDDDDQTPKEGDDK